MPEHDVDFVSVPRTLFSSLLPVIRDVGELKLVLCVAWLCDRDARSGVELAQLHEPAILRMLTASGSPVPAEQRLQTGLRRAVANGHLIRLSVEHSGSSAHYFLLPTDANRRLVEGLGQRDAAAIAALDLPENATISLYRPNVFSVYEKHIGPLTPLVAEHIRDAERTYSHDWIEDAILEAVHHNKRSWRYIETVLTQWELNGRRDDRAAGNV